MRKNSLWRGRSLYDNFHHYLVSADVYILVSLSTEIIADAGDAVSYAATYFRCTVYMSNPSSDRDGESRAKTLGMPPLFLTPHATNVILPRGIYILRVGYN